MMAAAAVMMRAVAAEPLGDGDGVVAVALVLLADAGQEEYLVVHAEAEEDGEHHHRDEAGDRGSGVDADELSEPPPAATVMTP